MAEPTVSHSIGCTVCGRKVQARNLCGTHYSQSHRAGLFTESRYTGHLPIAQRLELLSEPIPEAGCRIWLADVNDAGYGRLGMKNKVYLAHRVAWEVAYGPIPDGLNVLHHCDVPPCINEYHLFLGTYADNAADMVAKERQQRGETHAHAVLTEEQVIAIRADGRTQRVIARDYGVSQSQISFIKRIAEWRHLPMTDADRGVAMRLEAQRQRGQRHSSAKLTPESVRSIRTDRRNLKALAAVYGVSESLISLVKLRKAWAHVE